MVNFINNINKVNFCATGVRNASAPVTVQIAPSHTSQAINTTIAKPYAVNIRTNFANTQERKMYLQLTKFLSGETSTLDGSASYAKKLEVLLKNGKLLSNTSNDGTTTLQNLYSLACEKRAVCFDNKTILKQTIDTLYDPTIITQKFGDIPEDLKSDILKLQSVSQGIKDNPTLIDVDKNGFSQKDENGDIDRNASSTCVAANIEYHLASKRPAEFARWLKELTSPCMYIVQTVNKESITGNFLDFMQFLNSFNVPKLQVGFNGAKIALRPDKNAVIRAKIQDSYWNKGERSVVDVLVQSTIMNMGSQQTYESLTDTRMPSAYSPDEQGLGEAEKTFMESVVENRAKTSLIYQVINEDKVLTEHRCPMDKIKKHLISAIDAGEDVVAGIVETDSNNVVRGGHEITIVDYKQQPNGKLVFLYNETDDKKKGLKEEDAKILLPKIHHAGYPEYLVQGEEELLNC